MSRIASITVSLDLTVQPKQYQSIKLGLSATREFDPEADEGTNLGDEVTRLRETLSSLLRQGIHEEVESVYGKAVADYVIHQAGA